MKTVKLKRFLCLTAASFLAVSLFAGCAPTVKTVEGVYNVLEHGVKSDGKTDISEALNSLIGELSKDGGTLYFPAGAYRVSGSVAVPYKVGVVIADGAVIDVGEDGFIKFNSSAFSAPVSQIFRGDGAVSGFGSVPNVYPEWFGAIADDGMDDSEAVGRAIRYAGKVTFGEGVYDIDKSISLKGAVMGSGLNIIGQGSDKSKLSIGNGVIAFDAHSDGASIHVFEINGVGFYEKNDGKTSYAVKTNGGAVQVYNCHFEGLDRGVWFDYGGYPQFENNTAKNTNVVFEISERSMFIYFEKCRAEDCGTLVKAVVSPSGGVSNGILLLDCESVNAYAEDVYITENQAVWLYNCSFTGGYGGVASVYYGSHADSGIDNCVISSKPGSERAGVFYEGVAWGSLTGCRIPDCENAVILKNSRTITVTDSIFENNGVSDLRLNGSYRIYVARNEFGAASPFARDNANNHVSVTGNSFKAAEFDIAEVFDAENAVCKDNVFGK